MSDDKAMEAARSEVETWDMYYGKPVAEPSAIRYARALLATASQRDAMAEVLRGANAFIGVMFGVGAEAVIPETVPSPLGAPVKVGRIAHDIREALAALSSTAPRQQPPTLAEAIRATTIEECAKVADERHIVEKRLAGHGRAYDWGRAEHIGAQNAAEEIAAAIRSLKGGSHEQAR